jgi:hypothetical protein
MKQLLGTPKDVLKKMMGWVQKYMWKQMMGG